MSNDKTLADVLPGGMVRLGDQAERARFEAWAQSKMNISRWKDGKYMSRYVQEKWEIWQAALSAQPSPATCKEGLQVQPSPGGQGDGPWPEIDMILADAYSAGAEGLQFEGIARRAAVRAAVAANTARQPEYLHGSDELRARVEGERAAYLEGLEEGKLIAARQPVGEPVAWMIERLRGKGYGRDKYVVMKGQASSDPDSHLFWADQQARDNHRVTPLYASPAQAVDVGQFREPIAAWSKHCAHSVKGYESYQDSDLPDWMAERRQQVRKCGELLALIDSHTAGGQP